MYGFGILGFVLAAIQGYDEGGIVMSVVLAMAPVVGFGLADFLSYVLLDPPEMIYAPAVDVLFVWVFLVVIAAVAGAFAFGIGVGVALVRELVR